MAVVVMQQASAETPAAVSGALDAAGLTVRRVLVGPETAAPLDLGDAEGLILLDAPDPADTTAAVLVWAALAARVPVLALGAGAELLTGSAARAAATDALGGSPEATPAAATDALFAGSEPPPHTFRLGGSAWGVRPTGGPTGAQDAAPGEGCEQLLCRFAELVAARAERTVTRAFFTRRADAWEDRFAHQAPAYAAAVTRMRLRPGTTAMDLGCGTGRAMPALRELVGPRGRVIGVDVTPAMLLAAARHGRTGHGHLLTADCTRLPVPRGCVHGIFSAGLLDHLPDPRTALAEWARVAARDCVLLLFHPSGRAERAARHGRPLDPADLLAEHNLRPSLTATGWHLDEYEDASGHFLARATLAGPTRGTRP
ncbi:class I SAM-dependent methyltransferase [Streptomyces xanthochromogenes]|uniref:class I SAM-dependent methyltransferase n=1 Tax=Streptomyces xanthochromogenes TaxID=67384 RepID=UPI0038104BB9